MIISRNKWWIKRSYVLICKLKLSNKFKDITIKNHAYYFFFDINNIKNFDPNNTKIGEKSYKNILIYCTGYVPIKDLKYVKTNSVNPLYLIFSKVNRYFEEIKPHMHKMGPPGSKNCIFGDHFYSKKARKLRFHLSLHFNTRKHMISSFYLKWIEFTKNCEFVPI